MPDLFRGDCPRLPDSLSSWAFPPFTVPMATALSLPWVALAAVGTTLPTSCDRQRLPGLVWPPRHFESVNAIVSRPTVSCWAMPQSLGDIFLFAASPNAQQAFLQLNPEKCPSGQGSFKAAVARVQERGKTRSFPMGPGSLMRREPGAGWPLRATYLDWKIFQV